MTDEELCAKVASGDRAAEEELVLRYSRLVRSCSRPYFLIGGSSEDLIQEGMLGLLSAIRSFQPERGNRFQGYAQLCIRRRILSAIRTAASNRHSPLNDSVSLDVFLLLADQDAAPFGTANHRQGNPEDVVIRQENLALLSKTMREKMTELELRVLESYLRGLSYSEIAEEVQRSTKSVDNAVQRIRSKISRCLTKGDYSAS